MGSNQKGGARSRKGIERKQLESFLLQWLFHRTVIELSRKKNGKGGRGFQTDFNLIAAITFLGYKMRCTKEEVVSYIINDIF